MQFPFAAYATRLATNDCLNHVAKFLFDARLSLMLRLLFSLDPSPFLTPHTPSLTTFLFVNLIFTIRHWHLQFPLSDRLYLLSFIGFSIFTLADNRYMYCYQQCNL